MLDALPQPAVLATSAASYLVAPAAGRRVTAWMEFPAARATSPDAVARRRANRLVIANRDGRRVQVVYDGGCSIVAAVRHRRRAARGRRQRALRRRRRPARQPRVRLAAAPPEPARGADGAAGRRRAAAVHARRPRGRLVHRERAARAPARHLGARAHADRRADRRPRARRRAPRARDGLDRAHRRRARTRSTSSSTAGASRRSTREVAAGRAADLARRCWTAAASRSSPCARPRARARRACCS